MAPGSSAAPRLIKSLNIILFLLIFTLAGLVAEGYGNQHIYVMMGLTVGLLGSLNMFIRELRVIEYEKEQARLTKEGSKGEVLDSAGNSNSKKTE